MDAMYHALARRTVRLLSPGRYLLTADTWAVVGHNIRHDAAVAGSGALECRPGYESNSRGCAWCIDVPCAGASGFLPSGTKVRNRSAVMEPPRRRSIGWSVGGFQEWVRTRRCCTGESRRGWGSAESAPELHAAGDAQQHHEHQRRRDGPLVGPTACGGAHQRCHPAVLCVTGLSVRVECSRALHFVVHQAVHSQRRHRMARRRAGPASVRQYYLCQARAAHKVSEGACVGCYKTMTNLALNWKYEDLLWRLIDEPQGELTRITQSHLDSRSAPVACHCHCAPEAAAALGPMPGSTMVCTRCEGSWAVMLWRDRIRCRDSSPPPPERPAALGLSAALPPCCPSSGS